MSLFWNSAERRFRSFWRLLFHGFACAGAAVVVQIVLLIPMLVTNPRLVESYARGEVDLGGPVPALLVLSTALVIGAVTWLAAKYLDRRPVADFGFHFSAGWWRDLGAGLGLGVLLMGGLLAIAHSLGWARIVAWGPTRFGGALWSEGFWSLLLFAGVACYEELVSRGYHVRNLAEGLNHPRWGKRGAVAGALVLSSILFSLIHLVNPHNSALATLNLFLAGLLLAAGYIFTGELALPVGLHLTWNWTQGFLLGLPVSGQSLSGASLLVTHLDGPVLWTGGAFGLEGGLLDSLVSVVGFVLILLWVRCTRGKVRVHPGFGRYLPPAPPPAPVPGGAPPPAPALTDLTSAAPVDPHEPPEESLPD
jgi:membrane protease YdiL (CAAX protease family)